MSSVFDPRLCELGEGPLWHPGRRQLFWFDILGRRLLSRDESGPLEWRFDEMVSAAGWVDGATLLIASESALLRFDIESGTSSPVAALEAGNPATRSNDGRADPFGGFWIGTMGKRAETGAGAIYRFWRGRIERLHAHVSIPNAIAFSPDGRTAYFADTPTGLIRCQALDGEGWPVGAPEVFVDLNDEGLHPDGAVTDAAGGLWNAQWGAGRVARYRPDGSFDRAIAVPGRHSSCPAFGGAGFARLFVTTARENIAEPDDAQGPVYEVDPGIGGRPEPAVVLA